jgi:hypothetical protein
VAFWPTFSLQAISGAGYPGIPSLDILDNVIPYISGNEPFTLRYAAAHDMLLSLKARKKSFN